MEDSWMAGRGRAGDTEKSSVIMDMNLLCAVSLIMTESVPKLFVTVQL